MARLTLTVLGGFEARVEGRAVPLLPAKGQALLAYLALHPVRAPSRDKLATVLWGGMGDEQARRNLRHTVFAIRKALAKADIFPMGHGLGLKLGAAEVDALRFEELVARDAAPDALRRAVTLYRGDLLDGLRVS